MVVTERLGHGSRWFRPLDADASAIREAGAILERFRLTDVMDERVSTLPYGKQRQIEIASAFAVNPKVLLLDEPAAGVPESEKKAASRYRRGTPKDVSVLLIEHDMDVVFRFATRITVLVNGKVLKEGLPQEIANDPAVKAAYLGEAVHD